MSRWIISGVLETTSPLHIGDGSIGIRDDLKVKDASGNPGEVEVHGVAVDVDGRPCIPGTALKNLLRRAMTASAIDANTIEFLLGTSDSGGRIEFRFAHTPATWVAPADWRTPPYWSELRRTGVKVSTAIDRRSRTVLDERLFHTEYVPAGVTFGLEMIGHDLTPQHVGLVLGSLDLIGQSNGLLNVGAGNATGCGAITARELTCRHLDGTNLAAWLSSPEFSWCNFARVPSATEKEEIGQARSTLGGRASTRVEIPLVLKFDGAFLTSGAGQQGAQDNVEKAPDAEPLLDSKGRLWLPGESLKGALRSHAERILRTTGQHACTPDDACDGVSVLADLNKVCLACVLCGVTGWGSPLQVGHFTGDSGATLHQEFLAIDRFTGGGSAGPHGGRKFNVRAAWAPTLEGMIRLDTARLMKTSRAHAAIGLLAYVLRDLEEGDVQVGAKRAIGYGDCHAMRSDWRGLLGAAAHGATLGHCLQAFDKLTAQGRRRDV